MPVDQKRDAMATRLRAGDVFIVELPGEMELACRALLDLKEQCVKPKLLQTSSPLAFYADALLHEVYRGLQSASGRLLPTIFTWSGSMKIIGHQTVDPEMVDFPQGLLLQGPRPHFTWGELELPLSLGVADVRRINISPPIQGIETIRELALHALGRKAEIDSRAYRNPEVFSAAKLDLRLSAHRDEVHALLGKRVGSRYYETALRYGYDLKRFYGKQYRERELILCPYCHAPSDDPQPVCPNCGEDTRDDAPLSMTSQQLAEWKRKPCQVCQSRILSTATICPGCLARQKD
jgi:hypothetical protein